MKTTIEIPDDLYQRVTAKASKQGRDIDLVTEDLYRAWLAQDDEPSSWLSAEEWLMAWTRLGHDALANAPLGRTATELIDEDRGRLDAS